MMSRFLAVATAAAILSPLASQPALAFHDRADCGSGHAAECYREVRTPDLYTTRHKSVMVAPGWWETNTVPAVYGHHHKRVMVTPGQTVRHVQAAQWGVIHQQQVVRPGYEAWERRGGRFHDDIICKVQVPAQVATIERRVLVAAEKRVHQHIPARYEWSDQPYLIRPAHTTRVYHAPVYQAVAERVLVQRGSTALQPVGGHRHEVAPVEYVAPVREHHHRDSWK